MSDPHPSIAPAADGRTVVYVPRHATAAEHHALAASVGWQDHFDEATIGASLHGSLHGVVAVLDQRTVGMARLVGDGVHYFYVQDVIVHPDAASLGVGSRLVELLLDWVAQTAPARAFVGLFASAEAEGLYRSHGFDTGDATGMHRFVDPAEPPRA